MSSPPSRPGSPASQAQYFLLYDGNCPFCTAQVARLLKLARPGVVSPVNFQEAGALQRFPGLSYEACMRAMHLVAPDGKAYRGAEAAARALATRRVFGWLAHVYFIPGIRQASDQAYGFIAANRYRLFRTSGTTSPCDGACALHERYSPAQQSEAR
jgi:predicted DCC family thiol-disulfide oxidoreductase YuxK